jgi:hypothetical protein
LPIFAHYCPFLPIIAQPIVPTLFRHCSHCCLSPITHRALDMAGGGRCQNGLTHWLLAENQKPAAHEKSLECMHRNNE